MPFKKLSSSTISIDSPQSMFRDFSSKRVEGVLDYQGAVLDQYLAEAVGKEDVLLQMPTGSGKGLIGLLIAEWRRRKLLNRCVYLCPTNQLAKQVVEQAKEKYGIASVVQFKGRSRDYSAAQRAGYESGGVVAVTSYSALFNSNPYFSDANFIVLDDCHVSEQYVTALWTVELSAVDTADAFDRAAGFLRSYLSPRSHRALIEQPQSPFAAAWVDMLPTMRFQSELANFASLLSNALRDTSQQYSWSMLTTILKDAKSILGLSGYPYVQSYHQQNRLLR